VAQAVLRPNVMDFIELATRSEHLELQMEEAEIEPGSPLAGSSLKDSQVRQDLGIIVVAIRKPDGRMVFNPEPATVIEARDVLILLGHRQQLDRLEAMAKGSAARPDRS
jgi:voltage-gated potassium channel